MVNIETVEKDILIALATNSQNISGWLDALGESDPYKAIMSAAKLIEIHGKLKEMIADGTQGNINVNIVVADLKSKEITSEFIDK